MIGGGGVMEEEVKGWTVLSYSTPDIWPHFPLWVITSVAFLCDIQPSTQLQFTHLNETDRKQVIKNDHFDLSLGKSYSLLISYHNNILRQEVCHITIFHPPLIHIKTSPHRLHPEPSMHNTKQLQMNNQSKKNISQATTTLKWVI